MVNMRFRVVKIPTDPLNSPTSGRLRFFQDSCPPAHFANALPDSAGAERNVCAALPPQLRRKHALTVSKSGLAIVSSRQGAMRSATSSIAPCIPVLFHAPSQLAYYQLRPRGKKFRRKKN